MEPCRDAVCNQLYRHKEALNLITAHMVYKKDRFMMVSLDAIRDLASFKSVLVHKHRLGCRHT